MTPEERAVLCLNNLNGRQSQGSSDYSPGEHVSLKRAIADAIREAVAAERERCAKIADTLYEKAEGWPDGTLSDDTPPESWVAASFARMAHWIRSGTTPATEPPAPSPPQSDGG